MQTIIDKTYDEERALYNSENIELINCRFDGPQDGESAIKECKNIKTKECYFNLRYPFWHTKKIFIENCEMTEGCRAALWYSQKINISNSKLHGIKALRECQKIELNSCDIISPEFGWFSKDILANNINIVSEYCMMRCHNLNLSNMQFKGKYSFQYVHNVTIENSTLETKDAFWHGKNITIKNSTLKGEYLAWYSDNLTLINCKIIGTQPFCYCNNLKLIDCEMIDTDLAFEKSVVNATITNVVDSIKNPTAGIITVAGVKDLIIDTSDAQAKVIVNDINLNKNIQSYE